MMQRWIPTLLVPFALFGAACGDKLEGSENPSVNCSQRDDIVCGGQCIKASGVDAPQCINNVPVCAAGKGELCGKRCLVITPELVNQAALDAGQPDTGIQAKVFAPSCGLSDSCHRGRAAQEELKTQTAEESFTHMVNVPSKQMPQLDIVEPGDPDRSYLMNKILGVGMSEFASNGDEGLIMPYGQVEPLCQVKIDAIRQWIEDGANP